jgi:hypothetical protein
LCRSARLRDLFLYLCSRVLDEGAQDIHELEVGHKVFGRAEQYDTIADNIVRVHASMLRKRLNEFFENEGCNESFTIEIPKGNYAPLFIEHNTAREHQAKTGAVAPAALALVPASHPEPVPIHEAGQQSAPPSHSPRWLLWAVSLIAILFCGLSIYLYFGARSPSPSAHPLVTGQPAVHRFWAGMFPESGSTEVVLDDASLDFYQEATNHSVALAEYYDRSYLSSVQRNAADAKLDPARIYSLMLSRQSSFADSAVVWRMAQIADELHSPVSLQFARDLSFRQVKGGNVVLLGNPQSNPWIQPFEPRLSILWAPDPALHSYYPQDKKAPDTQRDQFRASQADANARAGYASISFLPNLSSTGNALILTATGGAAMGVAMDFLSDENSMKQLRTRLGAGNTSGFPYFDVLIKIEKGSKELSSIKVVVCRSPVSAAPPARE